MSDAEMTGYYSALAGKMGGKVPAQYRNAICLVMSEREIYEHDGEDIFGEAFYLVDKPHPERVEGFPLDCISVHIGSGAYYYDLEDPPDDSGIIDDGFQLFFLRAMDQYAAKVKEGSPGD